MFSRSVSSTDWSVVIGHRDVYHVVCMNAGVKRGARLAAYLTPRTPGAGALQPALVIRRSSPNEASASWPSGIYTLMYLQALYQLADVYRARANRQLDMNHEFFRKGPPVWTQAADLHVGHFVAVLHKYMWNLGPLRTHTNVARHLNASMSFSEGAVLQEEEVALQQQFLAPVLGAADPAFPDRGEAAAPPLARVPEQIQGRFARKAGAPMVPKATAADRICSPLWRLPKPRCPSGHRGWPALPVHPAPSHFRMCQRSFTHLQMRSARLPRPAIEAEADRAAAEARRKAEADRAAAEARRKLEADGKAAAERATEEALRIAADDVQAQEARSIAEREARRQEIHQQVAEIRSKADEDRRA